MYYSFKRDRNKEFWLEKGKVPLWRIAEKIGVHEKTLQVWLRQELDKSKRVIVFSALKQVKEEMLYVHQT